MLKIQNPEHFARVVAFAASKGLTAKLIEQLWYLHTWSERTERTPSSPPPVGSWTNFPSAAWLAFADGKRNVCTLSSDLAPASFYFLMGLNGEVVMEGGLIYHGDQSGWAPGHTYQDPCAVLLTADPDGNPWSFHS